jgi:hypothetical protein
MTHGSDVGLFTGCRIIAQRAVLLLPSHGGRIDVIAEH